MGEGKKIQLIKDELKAATYKELPYFIEEYISDERTSVQALVNKARKQIDDYEKEMSFAINEKLKLLVVNIIINTSDMSFSTQYLQFVNNTY